MPLALLAVQMRELFDGIALARNGVSFRCAPQSTAFGFLLTFEGHVRDAIASGRLVSLLEDWCLSFPGPFLYYPSRGQPPPALSAFVSFVRAWRKQQAPHRSGSRNRPSSGSPGWQQEIAPRVPAKLLARKPHPSRPAPPARARKGNALKIAPPPTTPRTTPSPRARLRRALRECRAAAPPADAGRGRGSPSPRAHERLRAHNRGWRRICHGRGARCGAAPSG
jgi:hypothetical protein